MRNKNFHICYRLRIWDIPSSCK